MAGRPVRLSSLRAAVEPPSRDESVFSAPGDGPQRHPNMNALKHGGHSETTVRRVSTSEKRAFLKSRGLRLSDLDAVGVTLLDAWARGQAKVVTIDNWFDANGGILGADGTPKPAAQFYFLAFNSTQRALAKLESHLERMPDPIGDLNEYLAAREYEEEEDDDASA